jgi:hypothetical protein
MEITNRFIEMFGEHESPAAYLRWSIISGLGAAIARRAYIQHGSNRVYANNYVILMGSPGSRKGTGPKAVKQILERAGYNNFAPNKGRKEAIWARMQKYGGAKHAQINGVEYGNVHKVPSSDDEDEVTIDDLLGGTLENDKEPDTHDKSKLQTAHMYIIATEWIDFIGKDQELIDNLTDLWDNLDEWDYERTTKDSLYVKEPTISMLGGATPSSFSAAVPASAIEGGFMRRLLLIHGEQSKMVTMPDEPDEKIQKEIIDVVKRLMDMQDVRIQIGIEAGKLLNEIYLGRHCPIEDSKFANYKNVRLTHLLKLCLISACARGKTIIFEEDVIQSHTILARAEVDMPKALGHFGLARNSQSANIVLDCIKRASKPISLKELYRHAGSDVGTYDDMRKILKMLIDMEKISVKNKLYVPRYNEVDALVKSQYFDQTILTEEEKL